MTMEEKEADEAASEGGDSVAECDEWVGGGGVQIRGEGLSRG
jgi:hypothetical protein